ncbi:MAG TPA: Ig-like domain repeat protein [Terriglobales bacterium]|nr:Ig-like domain repeat protein [Terriglobales bacterium]
MFKSLGLLVAPWLLFASCFMVQDKASALTKTTTTLTPSQNPSVYAQPVTFTAVVAPAPLDGETVTFLQGKTSLGTGTLSGGAATFTISVLAPGGTDTIKAEYPGDTTFGSSTSNSVAQVVGPAPTLTTLASSQNPSQPGQPVTFTATVSQAQYGGTPTGNVSFYNGSAKLGAVTLSGGVAAYTSTKLPAGADSITAVYTGGKSYSSSTSSALSQMVSSGSTVCGHGTGTVIDSSMVWDSVSRYYELYVPANLPATPVPMVLMLHGTQTTKSTGSDPQPVISINWGWPPVADANCFILVKPASTYDTSTSQWNWNAYFMDAAFPSNGESGACTEPPATGCPDDVGFLKALIGSLETQYNVNPNMVYVAGFSSGGQMAERVGVELSSTVAAIVAASGQLVGQKTPPPILNPQAPQGFQPVSVQEWHGTLDQNLGPCNYGTTKYNGVKFYLDTVDDTFNFWGSINGCTAFKTTQPLCLNGAPNNLNDAPMLGIAGLTGNDATGCANNVEVQFIWEPNIAHSWQQQYDDVRWNFFAAHPCQSCGNDTEWK